MYTYIEYSNHCSFFFSQLFATLKTPSFTAPTGAKDVRLVGLGLTMGIAQNEDFLSHWGGGAPSYHPFIDWDFPGKTPKNDTVNRENDDKPVGTLPLSMYYTIRELHVASCFYIHTLDKSGSFK
jgi:hypothetical protein